MSIQFQPTYYAGTDKETIAPVSPSELYYQEVQTPKGCALHSMDHFAGSRIVDINQLFQTNNEYYFNNFKAWAMPPVKMIETLKKLKLYLATPEDIERNGGIGKPVMIKYMEQHKDDFHLPMTSHMNQIQGLIESETMQSALSAIEKNPRLHRVIVSVTGKKYAHFITLRRDLSGHWRVLDSMTNSHNPKAKDLVDQLQPSFATLQETIKAILPGHEAENGTVHVIYPSEDTPPTALTIVQETETPLSIAALIDDYTKE